MLLAGFDATTEPYLRQKICDMVRHSLEDLAKGKLVIAGSLNLPGRPDASHSLPAGTVVVVHNGSTFEDDVRG